jgi:hypothetical protein
VKVGSSSGAVTPKESKLSRGERKAVVRALVETRVKLKAARQALADLDRDYPNHADYQAEDVGTAFDLKRSIRDLEAQVGTQEAHLKSLGIPDPRVSGRGYYFAPYISREIPFIASFRLQAGVESHVDPETGKRQRDKYVGQVEDTAFGHVGYMGSNNKDNKGFTYSASPIPYFDVGYHPVYGATVDFGVQGFGNIGVGSKGYVEGGAVLMLGPVGMGFEAGVSDPRLARVTGPIAERAMRGLMILGEELRGPPKVKAPKGVPLADVAEWNAQLAQEWRDKLHAAKHQDIKAVVEDITGPTEQPSDPVLQ